MDVTGVNPLFISHGAPDLLLREHPVTAYWDQWASLHPPVRGIVVISSHWLNPTPAMTSAAHLETIHDFQGFSDALYEMAYPARTAPWLLDAVGTALPEVAEDPRRGLDHGAWMPLMRLFPLADLPVVQLALGAHDDGAAHIKLGMRLAGLAQQNILVLGSGAITHNLRALAKPGTPPPAWAMEFTAWLHASIMARDMDALSHIPLRAPHARQAHPTLEHLWPLLVAMGAGWERGQPRRTHASFDYGSLSMSAYEFGA